MSFRAIIFDLDGTLLNTLDDLAHAMNVALVKIGAPAHPVADYRRFVGEGLDVLAARVLPPHRRDDATIAECVAAMREEYASCWSRATKPYDGIPALLAELQRRSIRCAVLSNKANDFVQKMVAHFFGTALFEMVIGAGAFPKKPDKAGALHIAATMGISPESIMYIGDSDVDMKTARNADMYPTGVLWGFRSREELLANGARSLVERPEEILEILNSKS
jgi:phosphoglycolate phosphatase